MAFFDQSKRWDPDLAAGIDHHGRVVGPLLWGMDSEWVSGLHSLHSILGGSIHVGDTAVLLAMPLAKQLVGTSSLGGMVAGARVP